jgi:putative transposase
MKGKKYRTEDKIRVPREADRSEKTIVEICREENISEVRFHRWKKHFGMMDVNEAKRLKELKRENAELKKMLAEAMVKNRVLEFDPTIPNLAGASAPPQLDGTISGERSCSGICAASFTLG